MKILFRLFARRLTGRFRRFTLVELLVVIAVIAILAGMLFWFSNSAREKAHEVTCKNNLKTIGSAAAGYSATSTTGIIPCTENAGHSAGSASGDRAAYSYDRKKASNFDRPSERRKCPRDGRKIASDYGMNVMSAAGIVKAQPRRRKTISASFAVQNGAACHRGNGRA